jgi:hypothetical protein
MTTNAKEFVLFHPDGFDLISPKFAVHLNSPKSEVNLKESKEMLVDEAVSNGSLNSPLGSANMNGLCKKRGSPNAQVTISVSPRWMP